MIDWLSFLLGSIVGVVLLAIVVRAVLIYMPPTEGDK